MAPRARSRPALGAVPSARLVSDDVTPLYDYDALRRIASASLFEPRFDVPTVVLGSSQSIDVIREKQRRAIQLRRRRGGGGLVLLQPDDLWVDWWIPAHDPRWDQDVRLSARRAGFWWRDALAPLVGSNLEVHDGPLEGEASHQVICFAGKGPGEVFFQDRKVVGVTQWRVREGVLLSSVLHAHRSDDALSLLDTIPDGLDASIQHHTLSSLGVKDSAALLSILETQGGPWNRPAPPYPL
jgi:hypothetical protein